MLRDLHVAPTFQYDYSTSSHRTVYYAVLRDFNFPESIVTIQKAITQGFFSLSLLMLPTESGYNFGAWPLNPWYEFRRCYSDIVIPAFWESSFPNPSDMGIPFSYHL